MTLRHQLKTSAPEDAVAIIQELDPLLCSPYDLKALLLIQKARKSDPLAYLALEAKWWIDKHLTMLKKRFVKKEDK